MERPSCLQLAGEILSHRDFFCDDFGGEDDVFFRNSSDLRIALVFQEPKSRPWSGKTLFCVVNDGMTVAQFHLAIERVVAEFEELEDSLDDHNYQLDLNGDLTMVEA